MFINQLIRRFASTSSLITKIVHSRSFIPYTPRLFSNPPPTMPTKTPSQPEKEPAKTLPQEQKEPSPTRGPCPSSEFFNMSEQDYYAPERPIKFLVRFLH